MRERTGLVVRESATLPVSDIGRAIRPPRFGAGDRKNHRQQRANHNPAVHHTPSARWPPYLAARPESKEMQCVIFGEFVQKPDGAGSTNQSRLKFQRYRSA